MSSMDIWMGVNSIMMFLSISSNTFSWTKLVECWRFIVELFKPTIDISFDELVGSEYWKANRAYTLVEAYLGPRSSKIAKRMKAQLPKKCKSLSFSLDAGEEIVDHFQGIVVSWYFESLPIKNKYTPEKRYLRLRFNRKHRGIIINSYLDHIIMEGKRITKQNSCIKLYSNNPTSEYDYGNIKLWSYGVFNHPVSFKHLAMDPKKKQEIINDLITFSKAKEFYAKMGKPWKRGYLLYGPPGTGKSSMIAAMSNLLEYDVYNIELTAVKNNSDLIKLLQNTTDKSIMVIEDIDCSLDLAGKRSKDKKKKRKEVKKSDSDSDSNSDLEDKKKKSDSDSETKVTLSGLLNFIDGLWSSCGKERIIVFTTNYVDKLDPALIRRGRMDNHIEMSYCCFEGFKILAKNYLEFDSHELFEKIRSLLGEVQITPADVAEHLMPKTMDRDAEDCLKALIQALEHAKEIKVLEHKKGKTDQVLEKQGRSRIPIAMKRQGRECRRDR
ncbi:hypothetical protein MKW92_011851 [Papaver armeniacum]|nr:hypothetical protein MKW92_011851 [Papaver armeniacum]